MSLRLSGMASACALRATPQRTCYFRLSIPSVIEAAPGSRSRRAPLGRQRPCLPSASLRYRSQASTKSRALTRKETDVLLRLLLGLLVMAGPAAAQEERSMTDLAAALRSRRWMLDYAAERRATVFTGHFAQSSAGHVTRTGDRLDWAFA